VVVRRAGQTGCGPEQRTVILSGASMAQEDYGGASYLQALKQSATPGTAAAAASARDSRAPASPEASVDSAVRRIGGAEKRRSTRFKCEGSAELRLPGTEVRTWATFTDISMHGCYVEASTTHPVGTEVDLRLEAMEFLVRTKGSVRVSYPGLGMGIAFTEMSEEDRKHLHELMARISRPSVILGVETAPAMPAAGIREFAAHLSNPSAAIQALVEFFDSRYLLMRDDFLRILRKSQGGK
jgi:hypothetical protein